MKKFIAVIFIVIIIIATFTNTYAETKNDGFIWTDDSNDFIWTDDVSKVEELSVADNNEKFLPAKTEEDAENFFNQLSLQEVMNLSVNQNGNGYQPVRPNDIIVASIVADEDSVIDILRDGNCFAVSNRNGEVETIEGTCKSMNDKAIYALAFCKEHNAIRCSSVTTKVHEDGLCGTLTTEGKNADLLRAWHVVKTTFTVDGENVDGYTIRLLVCTCKEAEKVGKKSSGGSGSGSSSHKKKKKKEEKKPAHEEKKPVSTQDAPKPEQKKSVKKTSDDSKKSTKKHNFGGSSGSDAPAHSSK